MSLATKKPNVAAAWNVNEASGSRSDQVGSETLTDNNTVSSSVGMFGNAASFTAANNEYLSRASDSVLQTGDIDFMVRLWVKPTAAGLTGNPILVSKDSVGSREYTVDLNSGAPRIYINGGTGLIQWGSVLTAGVWSLIHAWHDAGADQCGIAVNGATALGASTGGAAPNVGAAEFRIGAREYTGFEGYFDGDIDDVLLIKGALLDATERTEDYNSGAGRSFASWSGSAVGPLGVFSPLLRNEAWFDNLLVNEGWFDEQLIDAPIVITSGSRNFGTTGYATVSGLINLGFANGSISWWQYPTVAYTDVSNSFVAWGGWTGAGTPLLDAQKYNGDNKWYVGFHDGTTDSRVQVAASAANWIQNTWTHYLFTWVSGGAALFYCNGIQIGSVGATNTPNNSSDFQFGHNVTGINFSGRMAGLAIWNATLSPFDALRLAARVSPNCINPQKRVFYSTFAGLNTPEIDLWGAKTITLSNSPPAADGPAMLIQKKALDGGLKYSCPIRPYNSTRKLWVGS
jgi:hypothetical protein